MKGASSSTSIWEPRLYCRLRESDPTITIVTAVFRISSFRYTSSSPLSSEETEVRSYGKASNAISIHRVS